MKKVRLIVLELIFIFKVYVDYYPKLKFILNLSFEISITLIISFDMIDIIFVF
jgi:hypothetical protein